VRKCGDNALNKLSLSLSLHKMEGEGYKGGELQEGSRTHLVPVREIDVGAAREGAGAGGGTDKSRRMEVLSTCTADRRGHTAPAARALFAHPRLRGLGGQRKLLPRQLTADDQ